MFGAEFWLKIVVSMEALKGLLLGPAYLLGSEHYRDNPDTQAHPPEGKV
jgi:hypothetical protein